METEPTITLANETTIKRLEEILLQSLQQQMIRTEDLLEFGHPKGWIKTVDLKPLEFHEGSIVTQGFTLDENWKPTHIVFKTKHNRRKVKVIDTLITPELAVLYVDKDTRNWPYTKGCELCCEMQNFYTSGGIVYQMKNYASSRGTIHFSHDYLLDP